MDSSTKKTIDQWLNGSFDQKTKQEIKDLLSKDPSKLEDAFFKSLTFGTGGIRGIMGVGTNRINPYTIRAATLGLANYILSKKIPLASVIIAYDSRNNSYFFAKQAARVLAANGICAYLFSEVRPTPFLSFALREKKCTAGIMITASHNPPEYNGFKVYWSDGAQVLPPHDTKIIQEVKKITDLSSISLSEENDPLIIMLNKQLDQPYLDTLKTLQMTKELNQKKGKELKIVYTNLHGAGIAFVPDALKSWGFTDVQLVDEQSSLNGDFPSANQPNPEEKQALKIGLAKMEKEHADILLATDPDADRMSVSVMHKKKPVILTGNQIAALYFYHLCTHEKLPKNGVCIKSIVTTEILKKISDHFFLSCFDVLTGFKYIAQKICSFEKDHSYTFVFGAEESLGYLSGTYVRDKDGIAACCHLAELSTYLKKQDKTLIDLLYNLYEKFGIHRESLFSLSFSDTIDGHKTMKKIMSSLRYSFPDQICDKKIHTIEDYLMQTSLDKSMNTTSCLSLPISDALRIFLEDGTKIVVRPSGTEPKIKVYLGVYIEKFSNIADGIEQADNYLESLETSCKKLFNSF